MKFAYTYSDPLLEQTPEPVSLGWEVDRIYQDLGKRSELQQLFKDCQINPPNCLLIRRLEELGDSVEEVTSHLSQLEAMGITLVAVEQNYNSTTKATNTHANLLKLLHEIQRQKHSDRIRQAYARNRLDAAPPPGKAPYGYRRGKAKYTIDRSTSPVVKEFFDHFLLYGSLRGAVRHLVKKYAKKISVTTGRRWLSNPVYRGDTAYRNGEIIRDTHSAIISREEAAQVDRLLRRNSRLPCRTASAPRSLAGLVVCSECRSHMNVTRVTLHRQKKEYLYLRPINCSQNPKCRAISYQEVLQNTIETVCRDLPQAVEKINFPYFDRVKNNLTEAIIHQQKILAQIPTLVETGILDEETCKIRAYKLRIEISTLQAELAILPPVNLRSVAQAVSIPQFWLDLSETERRFYFREFIHQIEIIRQDKDWNLQIIFIF
ncbi:recombinase family protein [Plectonema cf. radiosum LEGE 06105]|uniref:Recombinase family protein n=1 Tax=Plectonema cf. radiosum LEGE 06105 TaxID=945769 RepID=A0A8J7JYF1_9CYAN|nr:recombinase family protein [Plectonema radiosum]MBE9211582.1 recombinase family protein [Plectonema cf. radiosum LEGE 06105]